MESDRASLIAERLHADDREEDGTPLPDHIRRVARLVDARAAAWLHEAFEWTAVAEHELVMDDGLESEELRALRSCIARVTHAQTASTSPTCTCSRATGPAGRLARLVKTADLQDRCLHPHVRADGWSPPYARGLSVLGDQRDALSVAAV